MGVTTEVLENARDWIESIHCRILNTDYLVDVYKNIFIRLEDDTKKVIVKLLLGIKEENEESFWEIVGSVLKDGYKQREL